MINSNESIDVKLSPGDLTGGDLCLLTDKVTNQLFSCTKNDWDKLITTKNRLRIIEKEPRSFYTADNVRTTKSKPVAEISVKLRVNPNAEDTIHQKIRENPLNYLDKLVLSACYSQQKRGNQYITVNTICKYFLLLWIYRQS